MNSFWQDFFTFRKMVSITIIKFLYILGLFMITLVGLSGLFVEPLAGIATLIIGNLFWRIFCESLILVFSIHQELVKLNSK
ncbi:MAG: hypothetical protein IM507_19580 [Microcystis sp. M20BS1]|uniref:hypothetical protein n=1 Tax=unclassified Microcystis TaxID=2643300 RepID=UPI00257ABC53|nr:MULTISPECIES: hypothetical protein [unclassified Microcystis]MCA2622955.1 hypothetical protein [Microcystis sp. M19BS1]MCA2634496.1 hypothetical protein [Microcystis sp. M20BS1]